MSMMNREVEFELYTDPQAAIPAGFCPVCGGERYWPGLHCARCGGGML